MRSTQQRFGGVTKNTGNCILVLKFKFTLMHYTTFFNLKSIFGFKNILFPNDIEIFNLQNQEN